MANPDKPAQPRGYYVPTNTWTQYGEQMPVDEVMSVLDRVDAQKVAAAAQSLQPEEK